MEQQLNQKNGYEKNTAYPRVSPRIPRQRIPAYPPRIPRVSPRIPRASRPSAHPPKKTKFIRFLTIFLKFTRGRARG